MILIHPLIDPVIVSFGFFQIRWYGLAYVISFIIGLYLIKSLNKKNFNQIKNSNIDDFFIWAVLGIIIGGRIGYFIFYQTNSIFSNPISILYIWKGGMSFHGGLIGLIISLLLFTKLKRISFFHLSDLISTVAPIGIFFGRIANFINVELYGRVTNFPIAIIYPNIDNYPRHPSQIYEALFEGLIIFLILYYLINKNFKKKYFGLNTSIFLILYGSLRFILEFLREPDSHIGLYFNLFTMGQFLCIPMIILGIIIFYIKNEFNKK